MARTVLAREIPWLEPVAALEALRGLAWPVLLDSARADPRLGRWSYVAADPFLTLASKDGRLTLGERSFTGDPFAVLQRALAHCPLEHDPALPPPFQTGADRLVRLRPRASSRAPAAPGAGRSGAAGSRPRLLRHAARLRRPGAAGLAVEQRLARGGARGQHAPAQGAGRPVAGRLEGAGRAGAGARDFAARRSSLPTSPAPPTRRRWRGWSTTSWPATSSRPTCRSASWPSCRPAWTGGGSTAGCGRVNPAPFAAYLATGGVEIVSASPERFLQLRGRQVETRPIKGTRPRGATPEEDRQLGEELLAPARRTGPRT